MPRKSTAELMVSNHAVVETLPDAPYNLTDQEADEWRAIVSAMKPGYFARSHFPLLSQLCRHVAASNRIAQLIESCCRERKVDMEKMENLLSMQRGESNAIVRISRQLRLSHQALYQPNQVGRLKARSSTTVEVPWSRNRRGATADDEGSEGDEE